MSPGGAKIISVGDGTQKGTYYIKTKSEPGEVETATALARSGYGLDVVALQPDGGRFAIRKA